MDAGTRVPLISVQLERAGLHWIEPPKELPPEEGVGVIAAVKVG